MNAAQTFTHGFLMYSMFCAVAYVFIIALFAYLVGGPSVTTCNELSKCEKDCNGNDHVDLL